MSFHLNPLNSSTEFVQKTQRIYIDPEQLIALKKQRKSFAMVPSVFQPPSDQLSLKQHSSWNLTTQSSLIKNKTIPNSEHKLANNFYENDKETFPHQKIKLLQDILEGQTIAPNVEFLWKLLPSTYKKNIINFQQGDCIPFKGPNDEKYLILSGEVRIIGINDHQFKRKAGYLFFLSNQTSTKQFIFYLRIKQIVALRSTKLLKIPNQIYQSLIKNYLYLKNSEKIKFIQFCPFLIWKLQLTQDLASCMEMKLTEKEEIIYQANSSPDFIYFVKEGIVLLERNNKLMNPVVQDFEQHYEKNQISEKDTILVVRKGMAFGIDGIIIKEFTASGFSSFQMDHQVIEANQADNAILQHQKQTQNKNQPNPERQILSKKAARKNFRIYTAKTLGKCELYCLDKKILETLFSISDIDEQIYTKKKQMRAQELQRMSIEYTNMLLNNINPQMVQVALKKKELVLKVDNKTFPKSKSLAMLGHRHSNTQVRHQRLNISPKAFLLKNKKLASQQNLKADSVLKSQFYLNEQRERNELRNRIKVEREKQKQMRVKKANNQSLFAKKDNQEVYMLPKIGASHEASQVNLIKKTSKKEPDREKVKLNQIIGMKLKQSLKEYPRTGQQIKNLSNISITNQYLSKESQLSKLLEESKDSKTHPSFINIKSYKSIISVYESSKN